MKAGPFEIDSEHKSILKKSEIAPQKAARRAAWQQSPDAGKSARILGVLRSTDFTTTGVLAGRLEARVVLHLN